MESEGRGNLDWLTLFIYLFLVGIGLLAIYSSTYKPDLPSLELSLSNQYGKQALWIVVSLTAGAMLFLIDVRFFQVFAYYFYVIFVVLLVLVLIFSKEVNGARSWFELGGFRLQPSEFAKFGTALAMASYLSNIDVTLSNLRHRLSALIIAGIPLVLIVMQGDAGSALVFTSFALVLYREGLPGLFLIMAVMAILVFVATIAYGIVPVIVVASLLASVYIAFGYSEPGRIRKGLLALVGIVAMATAVHLGYENFLKDYQRSRIEVTLGMKDDSQGAGYNVDQSMIAIGSGGFSGKGLLEGTQTKGNFVPEQHTDFIFSTIGEEFGWLGSLTVISLFVFLLLRIIYLAERQRNKFSRVYAYSVMSILLFHFAVNIGMTIKLAPVIGIPLPFFSYGGSSLIAFTLLLFYLLRLDANRNNELDSINI